MLIKLRNHFLFIIMSFTTVTLLVAFIAIYYATYMQLNALNNEKLNPQEELNITTSSNEFSANLSSVDSVTITRIFPQYGVYFNLIVESNGELFIVDSALEMPMESYLEAANIAWSSTQKTVEFANRTWQYIIAPASIDLVGNTTEGDYHLIRFLDVTETQKTLSTLAITLLLAGLIILIAFYFLGVYFSNRAIRPAVKAFELQNQFISDASHELKTPLSIISANTEVLYANKEETIESQIKWLDNTKVVIERMTGLIGSLLSLARLECKGDTFQTSALNVSSLLNEIVFEYEYFAKEKNIKIHEAIAPHIFFQSNEELPSRVIHILLDNAVKFTHDAGDIHITLYREKGKTIITVKNSHEGIHKENLLKIFDRFYRVDSARLNYKNSFGLGLSMAQTMMENLGGAIHVESKQGEYVMFSLVFSN